MVRRLRLAVCIAVVYLLQACVMHRFSYGFLRVDLLALLAVFVALEADFRPALRTVFVIGLLRDMGTLGRIGASPLLFVPAAAALMVAREYILRETLWTDMTMTFLWLLAVSVPPALARGAFIEGPQLLSMLKAALGTALCTAIIAPLVFMFLHRAGIVDTSLRAFGPE